MSDFRLFETNKKTSFLSKAKEVKAKREGDIKRNQFIIMLQKNVRAFMVFRKHDSPEYPLLMNSMSSANREYAQVFWESMDGQFATLRGRYVKQAIRALTQGQEIPINGKLENAIKLYSCSGGLKEGQYRAILRACWQKMDLSYIETCMQFKPFRDALGGMLTNINDLVDLIIRIESYPVINEILSLYFSSRDSTGEISLEENEQRLLKSYYNAVSILGLMIDNKQDTNNIMCLVSIMVHRLRLFYREIVMKQYNIDRGLFQSAQLREEIEETLKEKREWEEYESHLYHICKLIPGIMENYISRERKGITYALDILIQVTKLGDSVVSLNISVEDFFILLEKLNGKLAQGREDQFTRYNEYFIIILMIEKYLQATNDLKFRQIFQYEAERLKDAIRGSLIPFVKGLANLNSQASILKEINRHSVAFLNNLYNKIFRTALLKTTVFQDPSINIFEANYKYSNYGNTGYLKQMYRLVELCPFLLPIDTRFLVFRKMVREDYYQEHGDRSIIVNRGREFQDAMAQLFHRNFKSRFHILFINQFGQEERGMDAGGLTKEFLTRLFKTAFDPSRKWFIENDRKELLPNPDYWRIQQGPLARQYEFIGRLLGKSLRQNIMLGVKFAGPFLNLLINNRNSFDDLQVIDPDLYRSLIFIAEMKQGVEELSLTFQYHDHLTKKTVNLKPFGEKIRVTAQNKMEYVNLLINYKVNRSMERQTRHLRKGLKAVINQNWIRMFNYAEFNYLLSGTGVIDVRDWMAHTHVQGNNERLIKDFWSVVDEFTEEEKSLLLKFVTSCERPSFLGFKDLQPPFTIRITHEGDGQLPVSHTCSNVLDLPAYSNRKVMREKLLYAIKAGAGFEMA